MSSLARGVVAFGSLLLVAACGSSSASSSSGSSTSGIVSVCDTDSRAEPYAVGLAAKPKSDAFTVKFVDAEPAPPERDINTWTIEVDDANGKPMDGASIDVLLWMPDHNHGCTACPTVTPMGNGRYAVTNVLFYMPGIWQVTFTVTPEGASKDEALFTFCIDG